jgi:hypothetical protein
MPITLDQLAGHYPFVYHMAERDALPQVIRHGLLSTTAILDLCGINGEERHALEACIRKAMCPLEHPDHGRFALRDQKPLSESKLAGCLRDDLTPQDWLRLINRKVFFWAGRDKVQQLLGARAYRDRDHVVLEIDTRKLVTAHHHRVTLAAMNTGSTSPMAHKRGLETMLPLTRYPYDDRRRKGLRPLVELCVDYSVPDLLAHVDTLYLGSSETGLVARNDLLG